MSTISQLQSRLDHMFYGEMQITTENLTPEAINQGKWRIANYGGECDTGSTYFVGTVDQLAQCISRMEQENGK